MESLITSLLVFAIVAYSLFYIAGLLPGPHAKALRVVVLGGAAIWLVLHVGQIVRVLGHCC